MNLVIYGEGGLGHEILDLVLQIQKAGIKKYTEILFADDMPGKLGYSGYKTMLPQEIFDRYSTADTRFVIGMGEPAHRAEKIKFVKEHGYGFETLIHPISYVGLNSTIGEGAVVQRDAFISCDCVIGDNCLIQPTANIGHNCTLEENCILSTHSALSGSVTIGRDTYIAVGVSVIQGLSIGEGSVIGMGAVVVKDIPDNVIAVGNPAKPIRNKDNERVFKPVSR